jgi:HTH-type transcriptional regulator/antitoxin HipB
MNYSLNTPAEARAVLRGLRRARGLSQAQAGALLGVSQKRLARIEAAPGRASLDQVTRLVALLGGKLVVTETSPSSPRPVKPAKTHW